MDVSIGQLSLFEVLDGCCIKWWVITRDGEAPAPAPSDDYGEIIYSCHKIMMCTYGYGMLQKKGV